MPDRPVLHLAAVHPSNVTPFSPPHLLTPSIPHPHPHSRPQSDIRRSTSGSRLDNLMESPGEPASRPLEPLEPLEQSETLPADSGLNKLNNNNTTTNSSSGVGALVRQAPSSYGQGSALGAELRLGVGPSMQKSNSFDNSQQPPLEFSLFDAPGSRTASAAVGNFQARHGSWTGIKPPARSNSQSPDSGTPSPSTSPPFSSSPTSTPSPSTSPPRSTEQSATAAPVTMAPSEADAAKGTEKDWLAEALADWIESIIAGKLKTKE